MALENIENLSFDELKANCDELIAEAAAIDPVDLAKRYIQARTDSKQRDDTLAKQGAMLTEHEAARQQLESDLAEAKECRDVAVNDLATRKADFITADIKLREANKDLAEEVSKLQSELEVATKYADSAATIQQLQTALANEQQITNSLRQLMSRQ